jgi:hypothetical protein
VEAGPRRDVLLDPGLRRTRRSNVIDYAFTRIPAYARARSPAATYSDETTSYYWAVLPSGSPDGATSHGNPLAESPAKFDKRSLPPSALLPKQGARIAGAAMFRWTPADGARRYRLQVSTEKSFGSLIDDIITTSTSYTATKIYQADATLWWRVRAEDENFVGLTWSTPRSFRNLLPAPVPSRRNPTRGDELPMFSWSDVRGAVSYDMHVDKPDGRSEDLSGVRAAAMTPILMTGTGVFHLEGAGRFRSEHRRRRGPYSKVMSFTRTISAPAGARAIQGGGVVLSWRRKQARRPTRCRSRAVRTSAARSA